MRVRVSGQPKTANLHTIVTCSKAGQFGVDVFSGRHRFTVKAPAMRVLALPIPYPENCGVTAIGISNSIRRSRITVEILARCIVQTNGVCI